MPHILRDEIRTVLALSIPVALAELGWIAMSVVDTIMVGRLGAVAIGAIALGNAGFYAFGIFGIGLLLGMDTLVSQAFGANDRADAGRTLAAGAALAFLLSPVLTVLFYFGSYQMLRIGVQPDIAILAGRFLRVLGLSTLPLLLYAVFRRYLQATGHAAPVTVALISANLINWFGNWLLIGGNWGAPALGVAGSAWSTVFARIYLAAFLFAALWWHERTTGPGVIAALLKPEWTRIFAIIRIGLPAAIQILLEIGAFGFTTFLAGRLTPAALAAHQIAINVASVAFMVPLGIASAAAVTVGHAVGAREHAVARHRGYVALAVVTLYECGSAGILLLFPRSILRLYTDDISVIQLGLRLMALAALFQLFDGLQTVATGALRGLGSTRVAMVINLAGYWLFGIPLGYLLCFRGGQGIYGLWVGLTISLVAISLTLGLAWQRFSNSIRQIHHLQEA